MATVAGQVPWFVVLMWYDVVLFICARVVSMRRWCAWLLRLRCLSLHGTVSVVVDSRACGSQDRLSFSASGGIQ